MHRSGMDYRPDSYSFTLDGGGMLYVNQMGTHWSVDMWSVDTSGYDDPDYHAFYDTEAEALADAASWKKWDES